MERGRENTKCFPVWKRNLLSTHNFLTFFHSQSLADYLTGMAEAGTDGFARLILSFDFENWSNFPYTNTIG